MHNFDRPPIIYCVENIIIDYYSRPRSCHGLSLYHYRAFMLQLLGHDEKSGFINNFFLLKNGPRKKITVTLIL